MFKALIIHEKHENKLSCMLVNHISNEVFDEIFLHFQGKHFWRDNETLGFRAVAALTKFT